MANVRKTVLLSWVGHKDLRFLAKQKPELQEDLEKTLGNMAQGKVSYSPIEKVLSSYQAKPFDRVSLLWDYKNVSGLREKYETFLRERFPEQEINVEQISAKNAHSYEEIYKLSSSILDELDSATVIPYFQISSGTRAMCAIWVILGQSRFPGKTNFIQVDDDNGDGKVSVKETEINFNLNSHVLENAFPCSMDLSGFEVISGESPAIKKAKLFAKKASMTPFNILITGDTGTGKELFAATIHKNSGRKGRFIAVNCATIPAGLAESILFGSTKGAYTGSNDKEGIFEAADQGTIFLDELEACPPEIQAKLLRTLQPSKGEPVTRRHFARLGKHEDIISDVRIIAATNLRLDKENGFRSDLLNRVATLSIYLPALKERKEDIPLLAQQILEERKNELEKNRYKDKYFSESTIKFISSYSWPGNVRQLQNEIVQAMVFGNDNAIMPEDFPCYTEAESANLNTEINESALVLERDGSVDLPQILEKEEDRMKVQYIEAAFKKFGNSKQKVASALGIRNYQTLDNWITKLKQKGFLKDL